MLEEKIDMVIPYVNNKDQVWFNKFKDYCKRIGNPSKIVNIKGARYEDIGLINYQLKLIEKNMPFINRIFLLVSNKEQVPANISDKVKVVLHEQFIDYRFLPTFNSTTIEMFLWNIKGLSEYFIYANDDMLPTKKMTADDFFTSDGKIKVSFLVENKNNELNTFKSQCFNSFHSVLNALKIKHTEDTFIKPLHSFTPMILSHCKECFALLKKRIYPYIWAFRTHYQHNQYIYPIYENYKYGTELSPVDFLYTELKEVVDLNHQIVCVNKTLNKEATKLFVEEITKLCE